MTGNDSRLALEALDMEVLIKYVVGQSERDQALKVVNLFAHHQVATAVLKKYYTELPDAREEMAIDIRVVAEKQGIYIMALKTTGYEYLYLGSEKDVLFIGDYNQGITDERVLEYFGYLDAVDFQKKTPPSYDKLPNLLHSRVRATCVSCGVSEGDFHVLGCPVEQCPWCDGQLNRCNCRFDQLEVDEIENMEQLDQFEEQLVQKGRIPYTPEQAPSYPTAGDDPAPGVIKKRQ